jgi:protein gp37
MSQNSKIEWTQKTWNPVTGCSKVSQGCKNCYAEVIANRFWKDRKFTDVQCHPDRLEQPLRWRKPATVFVNSMSDLFHEDVPFEFIHKIEAISASTKHTYQILTKRPQRALEYFHEYRKMKAPLNWWLGVSVENQETADERIPILLQIPAAVRFLSCEPLLGKVDINFWQCECGAIINRNLSTKRTRLQCECGKSEEYFGMIPKNVDWVICGGESGHGARPMEIEWAEKLMQDCKAAEVPFFMKQICVNGKKIEYDAFPVNLKVRQMPNEK